MVQTGHQEARCSASFQPGKQPVFFTFHNLLHRVARSYLCKGNHACSQSGRTVTKQIPSMENGNLFQSMPAVCTLIDLPDLSNAHTVLQVCQCAVIRCHYETAVKELRGTCPAMRTHTGIHHGNEHGS